MSFLKIRAISFFGFLVLPISLLFGQSIVQVTRLPSTTYWDQAYGLAADSTRLFFSSYTSTAVYNRGFIYTANLSPVLTDSIPTGLSTSQGLAWDGTHFWYVRGSASSLRIYKTTTAGAIVDSILPPTSWYLGGACWDGTGLWVSNYYPNNLAALYKYDVVTKMFTDTIPTYGQQPQGIAWDGQYLYYAMDNNDGDVEKIYQVNVTTRDTVKSWYLPEGPTSNMSPRGLAWDGHYLWMIAEPVGGSSGRSLYKYDLGGSGTPDINLSTSLLDFGQVRIGQPRPLTVSIQNVGTFPLRVDSIRIFLSARFIQGLSTPVTIQPNSSVIMPVAFTPTQFGPDTAYAVLYCNDPDEGSKVLPMRGSGLYGSAFISVPSSYNFSARRVGSSNSWSMNVRNMGAQQLSISSITTSFSTFTIDSVGLPLNIDSLATVTLRVWFRPTTATSFTDTLKLTSNASNGTVTNVVLQGSGNAAPVPLGGILWEGAVPDNPYTSSDDPQTKSIKEIPDVNGDGVNDVIVASGNYYVMCFNGNSSVTGDILWTFNSGTNSNNSGSVDWEDALQIRDDINGDGVPEVVFGCGGGNEFVYTVSGRTGQLVWGYGDSINYALGDITGIRVDKDYNGDGVKDVLVAASGEANFTGRHAAICLNGLNGQVIFNRQIGYNFTYDVVSTRAGGAVGASNNGGPQAVVGFDTLGQLSWSYTLAGSLNAPWSLREIPDVNGDGTPEILGLYGFDGGLFAITEDAGIPVWTTSLGASNGGKIVLLNDLNNNGYVDFALSGPQVFYRLDSHNGNTLWSAPLNSSYVRGVDYLSDVNGDGVRDLAVATQQPGKVVVVNGANGNTLFEYVFGTSISQRGDRVAKLSSIDGNASTEFVGGNREGRVICFSGGQNTVGVALEPGSTPTEFSLSQNFPNPFNPTTTIEVNLPMQGYLTLKVFDVLGREVRSFEYEKASAGVHRIVWDGTNQRGIPVASGVYFYHARVGEKTAVRQMLLLK
jgi:hypothetical protein